MGYLVPLILGVAVGVAYALLRATPPAPGHAQSGRQAVPRSYAAMPQGTGV